MQVVRKRYEDAFWKAAGLDRKSSSGDQAITPAEAAAISSAIQGLSGELYAEVLWDEMTILVDAGWSNARALLAIETGFETVPTWALSELEAKVKAFGVLVNQREQQALVDALQVALANGSSIPATAASISDKFAQGYHIYAADGTTLERVIPTNQWSEMVARTELSRASNAGTMALYRAAQIQRVEWVTTEGPNVCPVCDEADGTTVNLGDVFDFVDVDSPPAHPRCACGVLAADPDIVTASS